MALQFARPHQDFFGPREAAEVASGVRRRCLDVTHEGVLQHPPGFAIDTPLCARTRALRRSSRSRVVQAEVTDHKTSTLLSFLVLGLLAVSACDDGGKKDAASDNAAADAGPAAAAGAVTVERLDAFENDLVNQNAANFPAAVKAAEAQLGKVNEVDGNEYWWAAVKGEDCHAYLLVSNGDGMMARSQGPYKVADDEKEKCKSIAG